jgi:YidC/Oxa1 family membrane protein insertase
VAEYHNPQNEPGGLDFKRLLLVFSVSFILIALSQQFLSKKQEPASPEKPAQQQSQQQQAATAPAAATPATVAAATAQSASASTKQATAEAETVIENELYKITFTNKGAQAKSWVLKKYKDDEGKPLELVNQFAASVHGYPLSLWTWDEGLKNKLNSALYVSSETSTSPKTITFDYSDGDVTVHKTFTFGDSYEVRLETSVSRNGYFVSAIPAWPAGFGDATVQANYAGQRIDYAYGEELTRLSPDKKGKKLSGGRLVSGPFSWVGVLDQYFAAIFLPDKPQEFSLVTLQHPVEVPKDIEKPQGDKVKVDILGAAAGNLNGPTRARLFVGPKNLDVLATVHPNGSDGQPQLSADLKPAVDFGFFSFFARPLFATLKWIQQNAIHNWGWAIIVLTVLINIVLLPLRVMSMRSALKMQRIAPQIQQVQDKYKKYKLNDPKRAEANAEISALYKEHNVNPAGGCLPMIIQLPFLWAFYTMLSNTIELRHAQWFWLKDLASPDRLFLIPIAIVVTMILMQRMTPTAGMSAEQARMMNLMMPVMIGLMSWSVASGLGLYWVTGTIVGILQQMAMNRTSLGKEMQALAAKRAAKKAR